jgi:hypothetical protein
MMPMTTHREVLAVEERLMQEFGSQVPAGSVIRCVQQCLRAQLRSGADGPVASAVEALARARLGGTVLAPGRLGAA